MNRIQNLFRVDSVDPEARNRVLLITGLVIIVGFAMGLIAFGYYTDRIAPNGETVFTAGDRKFSYAYLEDRAQAAYALGAFDPSNFAFSLAKLVSDIQNEELTRLIAKEEGVTLSQDELDNAMKKDLGLNGEATRTALATSLRSRLKLTGLSLGRYEEMIETQALKQKMTDQIQAGLPSELEQVELNLIQADTDAAAAQARQRILNGEDFGEVAKAVSKHSSASSGGALGWTPKDLLAPALGDAVFALEPGVLSDVIETDNAFYVVRIDGKETRALDESTQVSLASTYFGDKLEAASKQYNLQNLVTIGQAQRIANQLQKVTPVGQG